MTAGLAALLVALGLAGGALLLCGAYGAAIFVLSLFAPPRRARGGTDRMRVALVVVAHDEERVIQDSVRSLLAQKYPADAFSVFVVADRCTDRTRALAEEAGATLIVRDGGTPGKAHAVSFGLDRIAKLCAFDAVVVFDADNVVDANFVSRIAARLESGERAVQGFVDAKNPGASWVAASSALGYYAMAGTVAGPRERLGLSTPPMGTGFALRMEDARTYFSRTDSVTDDLELSALLALAGIRVAYEAEASLRDEKPAALGTALVQRHRWMRGRYDVVVRYIPELLIGPLPEGAGVEERLRRIDAALQLLSPSLSFTAVALAAVAAMTRVVGAVSGGGMSPLVAPGTLLVAALLFYALPLLSLARYRPPPFVWLCQLVQPAYLLLSAPLAVLGFLGRDRRDWKRTHKGEPPGSP